MSIAGCPSLRAIFHRCISLIANTDIDLNGLTVLVLYCHLMYSQFKFLSIRPMSWSEFTALLALGTAMSFSPGPNTTLSTALAANRGLAGAMRFVCAVPVGWGVLMLLCSFGLGGLLMAAPALIWLVKGVGCAYLLWLAFKLAGSGALAQADEGKLSVTFWQGAALQFVNIKAWMFALAVVAGWLAGRADFGPRLVVVLPTLMAFAFFSNLAYAAMGAALRGWLAQGKRLLWFNRGMGLVLVFTACWMITV
jgi:threonine/homoserine/homoserine lactone efflux protein